MPPPPDTGAYGLRWHGRTDRGKVRLNNEDAFLAVRFDAQEVNLLGKAGEASLSHNDFLFAVSDGMGGASAGEFASRTAVEKVSHLMPAAYKRVAMGLQAGVEDVFTTLFDEVHRALCYLGQSYEECRGMGATLSACWFTPGWMHYGHLGDSRIYYLPASGGLRQLSEDDTYVGWLYRQGQINEREARTHPRRNLLQKALGAGHQFVDPQMGSVGVQPGDAILLCTDGLVEGLYDHQLLETLRQPEGGASADPAARIVEASLERAGRDNTTALFIELTPALLNHPPGNGP